MSADNYILIQKKDGKWIAEDTFSEGGLICKVSEEDTLEEVIKKANRYMGEELVEYGLTISI